LQKSEAAESDLLIRGEHDDSSRAHLSSGDYTANGSFRQAIKDYHSA
jgi:hypothetical protein